MSTLRTVITVAVVAGLVSAAAFWLRGQEWPVEVVRIEGETRFSDRDALQDVVADHARDGFFGMDLGALREDILAMPWVRDVSLRRLWPDTIIVDVREHRAAARWNDDELVSLRGVVFPVTEQAPGGLPVLRGPRGHAADMLDTLEHYGERLATIGLNVTGLHKDERRALQVALENGLSLHLGREDRDIRLARFIAAWPAVLADEAEAIAVVDLRYMNGFAVAWRDDSAGNDSPEGGA